MNALGGPRTLLAKCSTFEGRSGYMVEPRIDETGLLEVIQRHARERPQHAFLTQLSSNETYTYEQLLVATKRLVSLLERHEIEPGSRVVLLARNHWILYPLLAAC